MLFEGEVKEFYYIMDFSDDGLSHNNRVQGKQIKLDEESLAKILDVPVIGVKNIVKKQDSTEFMIDYSNVAKTLIAGTRKKFLISEFNLVFELLNKVASTIDFQFYQSA